MTHLYPLGTLSLFFLICCQSITAGGNNLSDGNTSARIEADMSGTNTGTSKLTKRQRRKLEAWNLMNPQVTAVVIEEMPTEEENLAEAGQTSYRILPEAGPNYDLNASSLAGLNVYDDALPLNIGQPAEMLDSIVSRWYENNISDNYEDYFREFIDLDSTASTDGDLPDSVYMERLRTLVCPIYLGYNDIIKRYIVTYTKSRRGTISRMIGLSMLYFPMIEEELAAAGLPLELRMLPVIESALNPVAVSRMGATGLWQFMLTTGKHYGLEVTSHVDQRRDPVASTRAACRYLKDLYEMYGDWTLAIAAYNCGPGNVNKAIKRAGGDARTFWDIYNYLPRETRGYLPAFIGATYAFTYHRQHGIEPVHQHLPLARDTVIIDRLMHLEQVSSTMEIDLDILRAMNPQYKMDIIPAVGKKYHLTLPQNEIARYIELEPMIVSRDSIYLTQYLKKNPATNRIEVSLSGSTEYRVKSGDTLGAIARRHGVTVNQLIKWNNITDPNKLRLGQRLEIHK